MSTSVEIRINPEHINNRAFILKLLARKLKVPASTIGEFEIVKRSIDSRGLVPKFVLLVEPSNGKIAGEVPVAGYANVQSRPEVLIIGAGPAGYFAALRCLELGLRPIVIERGKDVRARRRDLRQIQQFDTVNPDSNYCFGEGGAGTYSDGKLYTRAVKRGNVAKVLNTLVAHGAHPDILVDAHPHIGSNKLPGIVGKIRETIEAHGGSVEFNQRVTDFVIRKNRVIGVTTEKTTYEGDAVILCTGHSARDIYHLCMKNGIQLAFKPYAIGVRIEHTQQCIDKIQYKQEPRHANLPPATYRLACQVDGQGVFSFCMCPGGLIVPTATSPGELVVNGMSLSKRDSPFANSGVVVAINENPFPGDVLGGLKFQESLEKSVFNFGDGSQKAPAQRLTDFVKGKVSADLNPTSYIPGVYTANFEDFLPSQIYKRIQGAILQFDKKMKGYFTSEAQVIGLESRTSAPVRIPRDESSFMSPDVDGLFPSGEGAGYAGGILSAALDGEKVVDGVLAFIGKK